jgi:hypothetical protein
MTPRAARLCRAQGLVVACLLALAVQPAAASPVTDTVAALVRQDEGLRPACRAAFRAPTAAAWCDPGRRGSARLRARGRTPRRVRGTRAVRLAGGPLAVGQRVRIHATAPSRRAQLAVVVLDGRSLTYVRFTGLRRRRLVATVSSRRAGDALIVRLSAHERRWRPVVHRTATLPSPPLPSPPPPAPEPPPPAPPGRLVVEECGVPEPTTAADVDAFNELWGPERAGAGWTGGDVTFSTPLPGGRFAWIFGDTFIGHVTPAGRRTGGLVNNSIVVQDGPCLTTYATGTPAAPDALLHAADPSEWYWPADATVEDDHLHVLLWLMRRTGPGAWEFEVVATHLATLALPDLTDRVIQRLPAAPEVAWGSAIAEDGDHTYVYGIHVHASGQRYLHVARTASDLESPWEYRTEDGWSSDPQASADQLPGISHQISVLRDATGYLLVTQELGFGADIRLYRAPTPAGPWEPPGELLARALAPLPGTFTYNAVAHPEFTDGGRLLLSYNVNSFDPAVGLVDASVYHPRFVAAPTPPRDGD